MTIAALILARGGSKGVPKKNILPFFGKPLVAWTIEHCIDGGIDEVFVSSDSDEILKISLDYGAKAIKRPNAISDDDASSESGWLHGISVIEETIGKLSWLFAPQATSPLRDKNDVKNALRMASSEKYDSLFSCNQIEDFFVWREDGDLLESFNYDWRNRQRRQNIEKRYLENGSFYMFRPSLLRESGNRLGGRIGKVVMESWKMHEIDDKVDLKICEALFEKFISN